MAAPDSVVNHVDILWYLVTILAAAGIGETLRRLYRIEKKQDEQVDVHGKCRDTLMRRDDFQAWFVEWKKGRDDIWGIINHHKHDTDGKVTRT